MHPNKQADSNRGLSRTLRKRSPWAPPRGCDPLQALRKSSQLTAPTLAARPSDAPGSPHRKEETVCYCADITFTRAHRHGRELEATQAAPQLGNSQGSKTCFVDTRVRQAQPKRDCAERTVTRVALRNVLLSGGSQSQKPRHRAQVCLHKTRSVSNC